MHRSLLKPALLALAVAALACQPLPIHGQSADREQAPAVATLDLEFLGGTALDYVNAIRKAEPSANIVVLGDLARFSMAAVKLKDVDVWSALRVLDQLPADQGNIVAKVRLENVVDNPESPPVLAVTAEIKDRGPNPGMMQTTVISMADVLGDNLKPTDALAAIETALGLITEPSAPAQIKFHTETGLLIARGTPEQIESIRQVISQLRERAGTLEARAQNALAQRMSQEQMHMAADANSKARQQADMLTREVTEQRTKAELLQQTVEDLRRQAAVLETELRNAQAERDQLMRTIADLQSKVKEPKP